MKRALLSLGALVVFGTAGAAGFPLLSQLHIEYLQRLTFEQMDMIVHRVSNNADGYVIAPLAVSGGTYQGHLTTQNAFAATFMQKIESGEYNDAALSEWRQYSSRLPVPLGPKWNEVAPFNTGSCIYKSGTGGRSISFLTWSNSTDSGSRSYWYMRMVYSDTGEEIDYGYRSTNDVLVADQTYETWKKNNCVTPPSLIDWRDGTYHGGTRHDVTVQSVREGIIALITEDAVEMGRYPGYPGAVWGPEYTTAQASEIVPGSDEGSTPPGTGTTAPACTRPDGTISGNPYDCAPTNDETKCGIIDIPCNLKKLFIPDKDFISNKIKNSSFGVNVNLPVSVVNEWKETLIIGPWSIPVGVSFAGLELSEKAKDQWRFMIFWGTFLWLLTYLGIPFLGGRQSVGDAGKDAAMAPQRKADAINAEYERLRADDSWKRP